MRSKTKDVRHKIENIVCRLLEPRDTQYPSKLTIKDLGLKTVDTRLKTKDLGHKTKYLRLKTQDSLLKTRDSSCAV